MTIDDRIREGFGRSTRDIDPDLSNSLDGVRRRVTRKRRARLAGAGLAAAALIALAVATPSMLGAFRRSSPAAAPASSLDPAVIAGSYSLLVPDAAGVVRSDKLSGDWRMTLSSNGVMSLVGPPGFTGISTGFQFQLTPGQQVRMNAFITDLCSGMTPGVYSWTLSPGHLTLTPVSDNCPARTAVLSSAPWSSAGSG